MQSVVRILGVAAIALAVASCNKVDFKKTKGGMPYKLFASKSGKKIENGNIIKVNFIQKINDSVLYTTYDKTPVYLPVNTMQSQPYDISEVLPSMKQGDSLYAVQLIDTFMKQSPGQIPPQFKKGDKIVSILKVLDVFKTQDEAMKDEAKERELPFNRDTKVQDQLKQDDQKIRNYLSQNNIQAQKTGKGTYVQVLQPGQGAKVEMGKFVSLRYRGTTFAGKEFDSNMDGKKPTLDFVVSEGGMIRGFLEGILNLSEGSKARLFIPSSLAYGPNSPSPDLGPNENLIFYIEVVKVASEPPAMNMPGSPTSDPAHRH